MIFNVNNPHNHSLNQVSSSSTISDATECIQNNPERAEKVSKKSQSLLGRALKNLFIANVELKQKEKLQNVLRIFRDVFVNSSIDVGEAYVMRQRYKDLEKIKDKEEYIKAVFEEAKNNYGFKNSNIRLEIKKKNEMPDAIGAADPTFYSVQIREDIDRKDVIKTIHHEFRHHKQHYLAYNLNPAEYMASVNSRIETVSGGRVKNAWKDLNKFKNWIEENLKDSQSPDKVSAEYIDFAKKCIAASANYKDVTEDIMSYRNNFLEIDARRAGALIARALL